MKKTISLLMAILIIISAITTTTALSASDSYDISSESLGTISTEEKILTTVDINDNFAEDEIIVVLNNSTSKNLKCFSSSDFSEVSVKSVENLTQDIDNMIKAQRDAKDMTVRGSAVISTYDGSEVFIDEDKHHQFLLLKLSKSGKSNVIKFIKLLEQRDDVILAMPNYIEVIEPMTESIATVDEITVSGRATTNTPNDYTGAFGQWGIDRIDLPEAWNITTGSNTVIVGVIDSGIRSDHDDLSANIAASSYHKNCSGDGTSALSDTLGHGTQVAGVIAAVGDNNTGTAGVCWNTDWNIKLASLKTVAYDSVKDEYNTSTTAFISAITHAKTKGITILNYSSGGGGSKLNELLGYTGLFVCASGNDGMLINSTNYYPASDNTDNMIVVAKGSDYTSDALASDSNYSSTYVDLSAPGVNILTTDKDSVNDYIETGGSSIAAPFVTGVAALLKSKYPAMETRTLKYYILKGVDVKTSLQGKVSTSGRLNAYKALSNVTTYTIRYDSNYGSGTMSNTKVIYNNFTPLRKNTFTKSGYTFNGWYAKRSSDNKCYYTNGTSGAWYTEGSQPSTYRRYLYEDEQTVYNTTAVNNDIVTLTAQWAPNYTIRFNGNDADSGTMADMSVTTAIPFYLTQNAFDRGTDDMTHWYAKKGNLMYYTGANGAGWYTHGNQPSGYVRKEFTDGMYIIESGLSDISSGDIITMNAYWEPQTGSLGDADTDGRITIKDSTLIQNFLANQATLTAYQQKRADVNFSGTVTIKDSTMIQKYVDNEITEFGS